MSILRNQLVRLGALLLLAFVLVSAWLNFTDGVVAQTKGKQAPNKIAEQPKFEIPAADAGIMKALDSAIEVDFKAIQMKEVLDYIEEHAAKHKLGELNFILDEAGLREAGINDPGPTFYNDTITKKYKKIKVRALLRLLLNERGMNYYFEDGNVILTKDTKADKKLVVKMYPVANLIGGEPLVKSAIAELQLQAAAKTDSGLIRLIRDLMPQRPMVFGGGFWTPMSFFFPEGSLQLGPLGQLLTQNIDGLTNQIKGSIEPGHWQGPGNGPGSMVFIPASLSLQIHCSLEVHYMIMASGLLDNRPTEDPLKVIVKVYSLAGLINPKNVERSKADLESALKMLGLHSDKKGKKSTEATSLAILVDTQLLVAKQTVEMHQQIERLLLSMRGQSRLHSLGSGVGGPGPLPSNLGGITFGNNGGNGMVTSPGGVFGSSSGVFGAPFGGAGNAPDSGKGGDGFLQGNPK